MTPPNATAPAGLGTVAGAVEILMAFTDQAPERGVTDLARELGMEKSRVHRLLTSLASGGLLASAPGSRRYVLGPTLLLLGERASRIGALPAAAQPIIDQLARTTRESVVVCVVDRFGFRTVASADGPSDIRFATELGRWFPGAGGATGHTLFAHHSDPAIAERLIAAHPDVTTLTAEQLRERHAAVRSDGYSISRGEFDPRVMAIAAPVRLGSSVVASLSVIGPPSAVESGADHIASLVCSAASELGAALAGTPHPTTVNGHR